MLSVGRPRLARLIEKLIPDEQRRAQRPARVARGRLNPNVVERPFTENTAVADAVQRDASGETQVSGAGLCVDVRGRTQHDLLGHALNRRRHVHWSSVWALAVGEGRRTGRETARTSWSPWQY